MQSHRTPAGDKARALHELDPLELELGEPLPGALCTVDGRVVMRKGVTLEFEVLDRLRQRLADGLYGGAEWPSTFRVAAPDRQHAESSKQSTPPGGKPAELTSLSVEKLQPGMRLTSNLYTNRGALLLTEGAEITYRLLARLRQYRIFEVQLGAPQSTTLSHTGTPVASESQRALRRRGSSKNAPVRQQPLSIADLRAEIQLGTTLYEASIDRIMAVTEDAMQGRKSSTTAIRSLVSDFLGFLRLDPSILPGLVQIGETPPEYLFKHGLNVALTAISAASALNLPEDAITNIGMGAMMQDLGMLSVPRALRFAPRMLAEEEKLEIKRHPTHSADLLDRLGMPGVSAVIAYQAHERPDRSGYPNGRHRMLIHPHARLVTAADSYVALSSERPHRPNYSPYDAMRTILQEASENRLDGEAVRTLLDGLSLFPLGSYVGLCDGSSAKVLRANHGQHTKPVVMVLNADGSDSDCELDLAVDESVRIVLALKSAPVPFAATAPAPSADLPTPSPA